MMYALFLAAGLGIWMLYFPVRASAAGNFVNSELPWHELAVDSQNKLLAWYHPEKNLGYDKVLHLAWDFLEHRVPNDPKTGLKIYLINAVFDAKTLLGVNWQGNPASRIRLRWIPTGRVMSVTSLIGCAKDLAVALVSVRGPLTSKARLPITPAVVLVRDWPATRHAGPRLTPCIMKKPVTPRRAKMLSAR